MERRRNSVSRALPCLPFLLLAALATSVLRPAEAAGTGDPTPSLSLDGASAVPQGFSPWALALTRDGQWAYLSFSLSEVLFKLRLSDMSVQAVADLRPFFPTRCQHIALSPDESRLFGVIPGWRQVIVIDTATMTVAHTVDGIDTASLFLSRHTGKIVTWAGDTVRLIDPATYAVTEHRLPSLVPARIAESPTDPSLWYLVHSGAAGKADLVLYRHTTSTVARTIPLPDYVGPTPATEMRVTPDEKKVFIGLPAGTSSDGVRTGTVVCVDLSSGQHRSVTVPGGFGSMDLSPDARRLWVGGGWPQPATDLISVIDTASDAVVGRVAVDKTKYGWYQTQANCIRFDAVDPNKLYVTSTDGNSLFTIAADANRVTNVQVFNKEELRPHWLTAPLQAGSSLVLLTKSDRAVSVDAVRSIATGVVAFPEIEPNVYQYEVAVEASGNLLIGGSESLLEVDPRDMRLVRSLALSPKGSPPVRRFSLARDGRRLYAVTQAWGTGPGGPANNLFVAVDRATARVEAVLPLQGGEFNQRPFVLPDARKVYVVGGTPGHPPVEPVIVHVVDEETLAIRKTISYDDKTLTGTTAGPYFPFAYDSVARTLFVGASWVVLGIDTTTDTISKVIRLDGSAGAIGLRPLQLQCMNAVGLVWHPEQRLLYIAHLDRSYVSVYDPASDRFVPGVIVLKGFFPNQLALSPDHGTLFAVNTRSDSVSVIDVATRSVQEVDLHSVLPATDSCGLACSAVAPADAAIGVASAFGVTVTPSRCAAGTPVLSWSFGDGHTSDQAAPNHAFASPGTYAWRVTASQSGASCSASGSVHVVDPSAPAPTWVIPSSARASGAGGAFYTTDLVVSNTGTVDGTLSLRFLSHDVDGRNGPSRTSSIGAGKTMRLKDVLGNTFGLETGWGGILVSSNVGTLAVAGETSTPASACVGGSFGQSVPAMGPGAQIVGGSRRSIVGVREDASFRTNLILANASDAATDVSVTLVLEDGTVAGSASYRLEPLGMRQVARVVRDLGHSGHVSAGRLDIAPASGSVAAYASAIDNLTNDPRTLLPQ